MPPRHGPRGGTLPSAQHVRCDMCLSETVDLYWNQKDSREEAGVYWPDGQKEGEQSRAWCPSCASKDSWQAEQHYQDTGRLDMIEDLMRQRWSAPPPPTQALPPGTPSRAPPPAPPPAPAAAPPGPGGSGLWAPGLVAALPALPPEPAAAEAPLKESVEDMAARIVGLEKRVTALEATNVGLEEKIGGLLAMIKRLEATIPGLAGEASSSDDAASKMVPGDDSEPAAERRGRAGEKP